MEAVRGLGKFAQHQLSRVPQFHRTLRFFGTPPERVYRHLYFHGEFSVEVEPGNSISLQALGSEAENDLFWRGFGRGWEGRSLQIWRELSKRARFIADVGANTGIYALAAQAVNPSAAIVAVEPCRRIYNVLCSNIARNGFRIAAVECAASDAAGTAILYDTTEAYQCGASLEKLANGDNAMEEVEVAVSRLDDILRDNGFPRLELIKIDVEMHEGAALRGALSFIRASKPIMLIEILEQGVRDEVERVLEGLGYLYVPIREDAGDAGAGMTHGSRNVLVCQPEALETLRPLFPELQPD